MKLFNSKSGKQHFWFKKILFSVITALAIFFGYLLLRYSMAMFITAVLMILFIITLLWYILKLIAKKIRLSPGKYKTLKTVLIIFGCIWLCAETVLRIAGLNKSYNEQNGSFYVSGYNVIKSYINEEQPDVYCNKPNSTYMSNGKGFFFPVTANNDGFRDINHPITKEENEYRIICLGNSFTEGIGAPYDSTWPALLKEKLKNNTTKKITVLNAGISSSDPFFEYKLLEKKLLKYSPDMVLLALGSSDFEFYRMRGGFERFTGSGIKYRKAPWWERLYAVSYIFRYAINNILHYNNLLPQSENQKILIEAEKEISKCINKYYELSRKKNIKLVIVIIDDGNPFYIPIIKKLKKENIIPVFDLRDYNNNIAGINPGNRSGLYWETDGHFNSKGYNLMAKGIEWNLKQAGILDSLNFN